MYVNPVKKAARSVFQAGSQPASQPQPTNQPAMQPGKTKWLKRNIHYTCCKRGGFRNPPNQYFIILVAKQEVWGNKKQLFLYTCCTTVGSINLSFRSGNAMFNFHWYSLCFETMAIVFHCFAIVLKVRAKNTSNAATSLIDFPLSFIGSSAFWRHFIMLFR